MENKEQNLVEVVKESGVINPQAELIISTFKPLFEEANDIILANKDLVVKDETDILTMQIAKESRKKLQKIRTDADKARVNLKADAIKYGDAVQGVFNLLKKAIVPVEEHLESQEKFVENLKKEKAEAIRAAREATLRLYIEDISLYNYAEMTDAVFTEFVSDLKRASEIKKEREAEEEKKKIELEKKHVLWEKRQFELQPYMFFFDTLEFDLNIDTDEEEFKKILTMLKKIKSDYDAEQLKIKEENDKLKKDAEIKAKKDADEKKIADAKLKEEQDARKKVEDELKAKKEEEEKNKQLVIEKERQAKLAPEKDKLTAYAEAIRTIQAPADLSKAGLEIVKKVEQKLLELSQEIKSDIKLL